MRIPERSRNIKDLKPEEIAKLIANPILKEYVIAKSDKYYHWDNIKRRTPPEGFDIEEVWFAFKFNRIVNYEDLPFKDSSGMPFVINCCKQLQRSFSYFDKYCAGNFGAKDDDVFVTSTERSRYLISSLIDEEVISSAQLEGACTTRKVAKKIISAQVKPKNSSERMIYNNYLLMRKVVEYKDKPLDVELLLELQQIATEESVGPAVVGVGKFRESDDVAVVDNSNGETLHQPPPYTTLKNRIKIFCDFANQDHHSDSCSQYIHPTLKAVILHFMIGYDHPFDDGNGRTARALFYWYLLKTDYWIFEYVSISALLKKAPAQYVQSYLYTETDDNDLTYFAVYQFEIMKRAIERLRDHIKKAQDDSAALLEKLDKQGGANKFFWRHLEIIKKIIKHPGRTFNAKYLCNEFSVTANTVRKDLNYLVSLKLLLPTKEGKTTMYVAPSDIKERLENL